MSTTLAAVDAPPGFGRAAAAERLADAAALLARRNEALEDFAALVAHEVKASLHLAIKFGASTDLQRAIELVDEILEAEKADPTSASSAPRQCLEEALRDLGPVPAAIQVALPVELPFDGTALRIVLRNLIANALSAGARRVQVVANAGPSAWELSVFDDGVGPGSARYAHGCGIGLRLVRRIVERAGGMLELRPSIAGGTRASVVLPRASR